MRLTLWLLVSSRLAFAGTLEPIPALIPAPCGAGCLNPLDALAAPPRNEIPADLLRLGKTWGTDVQLQKIAAEPGIAAPDFRFVVLGDVEEGRFFWSRILFNRRGVFSKQLKRIDSEDPAFVIQLGDMVSTGKPKNYRKFFKLLERSGLDDPYLTVIGNHDRQNPHGHTPADLYQAIFGKLNYYFEVKGVRMIVVDTSLKEINEQQLRWLEEDALATDKRKVVFTHMPPAPLRPWTFGGGGFKIGSQRFHELMASHRVDRVFLGHVHGYGTMERDGVRYVLSGGGGSPLYPSGASRIFHHYITVDVGADGLHETVHPLEGEPFPIDWGALSAN